VLLVHDHEAQTIERREDGRSGTDDDVHVAAPDAAPLVVTLPVGQAAVLDGEPLAKNGPEDCGERRSETDLGHQHQHRPTGAADLGGQPQVDLGLPTARDAVHERGREASG